MPVKKNKPKLPERVMNELKFRALTVKRKDRVAECFYRVIFTGEQLDGFSSAGFDDHIKLFFPTGNAQCALPKMTDDGLVWPDGLRPVSRDYTPLAFDAERNELTIDFFIHRGGIASHWAEKAQPGDTLMIGGPRGSMVIPVDYAWQLYICDETGLPAVLRRLRALPENIAPQVLVNCTQSETRDYLAECSQAHIEWLDSQSIAAKIQTLSVPAEDYFVWITGEGEEVKQLSAVLLATQGLDSDYVRAAAYWHKK